MVVDCYNDGIELCGVAASSQLHWVRALQACTSRPTRRCMRSVRRFIPPPLCHAFAYVHVACRSLHATVRLSFSRIGTLPMVCSICGCFTANAVRAWFAANNGGRLGMALTACERARPRARAVDQQREKWRSTRQRKQRRATREGACNVRGDGDGVSGDVRGSEGASAHQSPSPRGCALRRE